MTRSENPEAAATMEPGAGCSSSSSSVQRWRGEAARAWSSSRVERWRSEAARAFQHCLDRAAPHTAWRWAGALLAAAAYALRVYYVHGFVVVSFGLLARFLLKFLPPVDEPALDGGGPALPTRLRDREFMFWYGIKKDLCVAFAMTFFWVFDDIHIHWLVGIILLYTIAQAHYYSVRLDGDACVWNTCSSSRANTTRGLLSKEVG